MLEGEGGRWGGELRRRQVFRRLAERTAATVIEGFGPDAVRRAFGPRSYVPLPLPSLGGQRPRLAASDPLRPDVLWALRRLTDPAVLAYYDDPIARPSAGTWCRPRRSPSSWAWSAPESS